MGYKTILTTWDGTDLANARLEAAATLANRFDAHLTVLCFGVAPTMTTYAYGEGYAMIYADQMKSAQEDAEALRNAAVSKVEALTSRGEVRAVACGYESLARVMGEHSRYADLTVLSPPALAENDSHAHRMFDGALMDGSSATLMIGADGALPSGATAMIAWDESGEALAAVRNATPLLDAAARIEVVLVDPRPDEGVSNREPGADISLMLSRHGYNVTVSQLPSAGQAVSEVLNRHALDIGADLMVMGAYSHNRFWESVVGGVTRDILANVKTPTLMAH